MFDEVLKISGGILVIFGALAAIGGAMRWIVRRARRLDRILSILLGEPAEPGLGRPRVVGVVERLDQIPGLIAAGQADHVARWHGHTPPPPVVPTWVDPYPNGSRPGGVASHRRPR